LRGFSVGEVQAMIGRGEIRDAKTIVGLALFLGISGGHS
jgi:hypothetical protein